MLESTVMAQDRIEKACARLETALYGEFDAKGHFDGPSLVGVRDLEFLA